MSLASPEESDSKESDREGCAKAEVVVGGGVLWAADDCSLDLI